MTVIITIIALVLSAVLIFMSYSDNWNRWIAAAAVVNLVFGCGLPHYYLIILAAAAILALLYFTLPELTLQKQIAERAEQDLNDLNRTDVLLAELAKKRTELEKVSKYFYTLYEAVRENNNLVIDPVLLTFFNRYFPILRESVDSVNNKLNRNRDADEKIGSIIAFTNPLLKLDRYIHTDGTDITGDEVINAFECAVMNKTVPVQSGNFQKDDCDWLQIRLNQIIETAPAASRNTIIRTSSYLEDVNKLLKQSPDSPVTRSAEKDLKIKVIPALQSAAERLEKANDLSMSATINEQVKEKSYEVIQQTGDLLEDICKRLLSCDLNEADVDLTVLNMLNGQKNDFMIQDSEEKHPELRPAPESEVS